MILLHTLRDIPQDTNQLKVYHIEYNIFNQIVRYKLDFSNSKPCGKDNTDLFINLNRLKLFYVFSQ